MTRAPRFYCPTLLPDQTSLALPETVVRHAVQVLRLKAGSAVRLFDGHGYEVLAQLTAVDKRHATAHVESVLMPVPESALHLTLLQGISRGERMDFALQKAVELGVQVIYPVQTQHGQVPLTADKARKRLAHWQGIIESACEQSGRATLPSCDQVLDFAQALQLSAECRIVLDPRAHNSLHTLPKPSTAAVLIGPEGGLSTAEIDHALTAGWQGVRLGPRILRTETAAIVAVSAMQTLWGDFA